jgi:hypothetical protein
MLTSFEGKNNNSLLKSRWFSYLKLDNKKLNYCLVVRHCSTIFSSVQIAGLDLEGFCEVVMVGWEGA